MSVGHAVNHLRDRMTDKMVVSGALATGATVTPAQKYGQTFGDTLVTQGFWGLAYAEWFQVLGATWITILIASSAVKFFKSLVSKNKE